MRLKTWLQKAFTENIPLKTAALLIAVILWLFVTSKGLTEASFDVPVDFVNIPQGLDIVRYDIKTVNIVIRGYERFIKNIKQGDIRINVDLSRAKKGEAQLPIRAGDIRLPNTVSVVRIDPSSLRVILEEKTTKKVPVKPVITGKPDRGYSVSSIKTIPEEIRIEGITSELKRINFLYTEPVDISGLRDNLTQEVSLDLAGKKIKPERDKVEIAIKIRGRGK
ncbi:MAG: YbbR-like domain-containing protein [Thermodesulfovibrionales bacterium]